MSGDRWLGRHRVRTPPATRRRRGGQTAPGQASGGRGCDPPAFALWARTSPLIAGPDEATRADLSTSAWSIVIVPRAETRRHTTDRLASRSSRTPGRTRVRYSQQRPLSRVTPTRSDPALQIGPTYHRGLCKSPAPSAAVASTPAFDCQPAANRDVAAVISRWVAPSGTGRSKRSPSTSTTSRTSKPRWRRYARHAEPSRSADTPGRPAQLPAHTASATCPNDRFPASGRAEADPTGRVAEWPGVK
jgi:hypothetical protein